MAIDTKTTKTTRSILLLGSSGFIGQQVRSLLEATDCQLQVPSRQQVDFIHPDLSSVASLLKGVDVVVNMVGIMSQDSTLLEQVHLHTPRQIAALAKQADVTHWINLSALGANAHHKVAFVGSKGRGDEALRHMADDRFRVSVVRPSLVFGRGGASCELFIKLARLPVLMMPEAGAYKVQPVHVDDVAQGLTNLALNSCATRPSNASTTIAFTGATVGTLAQYISMMRQAIHRRGPLKILPLPISMARAGATVLSGLTNGVVSQDSLTLLTEGSVASNEVFTELLGYMPLGYRSFVT